MDRKTMVEMREKTLLHNKAKLNLIKSVDCSTKENEQFKLMEKRGETLPDNVYVYADSLPNNNEYYRIIESDLTAEEIEEYLKYRKVNSIITIKNCILYFTVLSIISLISSAIICIVATIL